MNRHPARWYALLLWLCVLPAFAQTRAWLDRDRITYGETVTLNIQTGLNVRQVDYRPLAAQFEVSGQTVRRSYDLVGGRATTRSLFAVGLRPRGPGVLQVPALRVGNARTTPLRLVVMPPTVQPANGGADAFVETGIDATQPYVQQAVGVVVRLHYAVPLLSAFRKVIGAVDFEDQSQLDAAEVGRIRGDRILAAKLLVADLPVANPLPDGVGELVGRGALRTGELDGVRRSCAASLRPSCRSST